MSSAPVRGIVPHRPRRHHHHHHHHHQHDKCRKRNDSKRSSLPDNDTDNRASDQLPDRSNINGSIDSNKVDAEVNRPKVNPIFLWAAQREQRIVEVRCEDYDKRNRIKLTKTAQGWRSIPRTVLTTYSTESLTEAEPDEETTSSTPSRNEEKENSSAKLSDVKHVKKDLFDNTLSGCTTKFDRMKNPEEKIKRKRKKHAGCSKNKRRKTDLDVEDSSAELLLGTSWKMKKRRKYDKNKKAKRMRVDKEITDVTNANDVDEIMTEKEESEKHNSVETKNGEDSSPIANKNLKSGADSLEKSISLIDDDAKRSDLEVIKKSRHLQPRVVLEQLHFPLLSTKTLSRTVKSKESEENSVEHKGANKINLNKFAKTNKIVENETPVDVNIEETVINKEDLQEILNKLDSNHIPIEIDKTKFNLIENKELLRNCTKIGVAILPASKKDDDTIKALKEIDKQNLHPPASERRGKFSVKDKSKSRPGSRSLDETIERLEKSISSQRKMISSPNIYPVTDSKLEPKAPPQTTLELSDTSTLQDSTDRSTPVLLGFENDKNDSKHDCIPSSKSLDFLKNMPGLSVTLANDKEGGPLEKDVSSKICVISEHLGKDVLSVNNLPDSQTEVVDNVESHSKLLDDNPLVAARSDLKSRVDSPESTVNFSKHEDSCDPHNHEMMEVGYCKARLIEAVRSQSDNENCSSSSNNNNDNNNHNNNNNNNNTNNNNNDFFLNVKDCQTYLDDEVEENVVNSSKTAMQKSLSNQIKSSEAQAKPLSLPKYQKIDEYNKQIADEFRCQVSPQPSGLPPSTSPLTRSSSAYLERLLPSPPCSVSCSDDAKNDLTLKSILSMSNGNLKNTIDKEMNVDLDISSDLELNSAYELPIKHEKLIIQDKKQIIQKQVTKLEKSHSETPVVNEDVGESSLFASDCVFSKRSPSAEWSSVDQLRSRNHSDSFPDNKSYLKIQNEYIGNPKMKEAHMNPVAFLDPANQLRELTRTSGHLIPDPLLVPRDYLPLIASAPLTEIPNLLATRPELRLPEALTRPELLTDPDLLVISLAHLQYVLDHGEASTNKNYQPHQPLLSTTDDNKHDIVKEQVTNEKCRPKLSCKPIGTLMPAPIDLSNNQKLNPKPPLLRVRSGLLKQESEVSSTANSPDDLQLWHPLFGSQKQRQQERQSQEQKQHQASWHRTTLTS